MTPCFPVKENKTGKCVSTSSLDIFFSAHETETRVSFHVVWMIVQVTEANVRGSSSLRTLGNQVLHLGSVLTGTMFHRPRPEARAVYIVFKTDDCLLP